MTNTQRMCDGLKNGTIEVDLNVTAPPASGTFRVVQEHARERADDLSNGRARVAWVYHLVDGKRPAEWSEQISVTDEECSILVEHGAKWVGAEWYAPAAWHQRQRD